MNQSNCQEAFIIYFKGVAVHLQWSTLPPLERPPALRICQLDEEYLLLLTADNCLYRGRFNASKNILHLDLEMADIVDVDKCTGTQQLFLVTQTGAVLMQQLTSVSGYRTNGFQQLSFDPLELSETGVRILNVRCTDRGIIFVTELNEIYAMGSCGEVFNAEIHPKHFRIFEKNSKIIDIAAGDEFFIILLQRNYKSEEEILRLQNSKILNKTKENLPKSSSKISLDNSIQENGKKTELNSNSSLKSYSSKSSNSNVEPTFEMRQQEIILKGYSLVNTQVLTFGAVNKGLLGTGDHIKRSSLNVLQKLDSIGVCNIAAGREHSIASTLDGRIYHWGLNNQKQLSDKTDVEDISAPNELNFDAINLSKEECNIVETCCGDYQTIILNANEDAIEKGNKILPLTAKDLLTLQLGHYSCIKPIHLLLSSGSFTLRNLRSLRREYFTCYNELQIQMKLLLKYRHSVNLLRHFQRKTNVPAIKIMQEICICYKRVLYVVANFLESLKSFYISDQENPTDLIFINSYRECIKIFEDYVKAFCDIFSIDGYAEALRISNHFSSTHLLAQTDVVDLMRVFEQPLKSYPIIVEFLEQLLKKRDEFKEHLNSWQTFIRESRISLELAENTQDFWRSNERNVKLQHFCHKSRRVILTSERVPLKLSNSMTMTSPTFILFSDCLCQVGSQVHTYPLTTLWVRFENDTSLLIITPERKLTLTAKSHLDKMLWFDQLESSIMSALGQPGEKQTSIRTTAYVFSNKHSKYPKVHAYGRWRNGVMHGNCYLEYPDGRFYCGDIKNGDIEGQGKMVIPSIGLYEGYFKAGKFHGFGVYEMKDNEVYEGNFKENLFHGHGFMRTNNYTYVGEYAANVRSGYGILDDMLTGHKYMGMFAENRRVGAGTCITMNGDYFEGIFTNDELSGNGLAVFENDYYYEGELNMNGPNGRGTYYMPSGSVSDKVPYDDIQNQQLIGNVLSGQLSGNWNDVRVNSGKVSINRQFPKYPKSIGEFSVDNNRKWCALFENFENQIMNASGKIKQSSDNTTMNHPNKLLWSRMAIFMTTEREKERKSERQDVAMQSTHSYFAKNISLNYSGGLDKLSIKSSNSILNNIKTNTWDLNSSISGRRAQSQENVYVSELNDLDTVDTLNFNGHHSPDSSFSSLLNPQIDGWLNGSRSSTRSSLDSIGNFNNNSLSAVSELQFTPNFGINTLTEEDVALIKDYLSQAFKDRHHPLFLLNKRISNCFYTAYGCWKVKPSPLLAKQALLEWESISKRIYKFIRKLFPSLPEDYCIMESSREVISHITLLYPIVLSEGIYSTLFLLYANKYSRKDEMYRQNVNFAEKLSDEDLASCLSLECTFLPVIRNSSFLDAIRTLKQLQEKYSPKDMLTVIETCMQQITEAYKVVETGTASVMAADSMMPLTLLLTLRAAVPHLGAELALLDDLTGGSNYQFEMNGLAGYCFTTLKAAYEHITSKSLKRY